MEETPSINNRPKFNESGFLEALANHEVSSVELSDTHIVDRRMPDFLGLSLFTNVTFEKCHFCTDFQVCVFENCNFINCMIYKSELLSCSCVRTNFLGTKIFKTIIRDSNFMHARFKDTEIFRTQVNYCDFRYADFNGSKIDSSGFRDSYFYSYQPSKVEIRERVSFNNVAIGAFLDATPVTGIENLGTIFTVIKPPS